MSLENLASMLRYAKSSLARYETAESMIPPDLPKRLDAVFGADGLFGKLYEVARKENPDGFRRVLELEAQAKSIQDYSGQLVPGLAQTESYARALFETFNPKASRDEIERLVTERMSRQARLTGESAVDLWTIVDEATLRRSYGGPVAMREQLNRLAGLTQTPNTVLQVLPFESGGHPLAGGSLKLMTMRNGTRIAYEESISTGNLIEEREAVESRQRAYDLLRACALSPRDSAALIRSVRETLPS
ncbi:DUF5753 domain-containing protein [Streptomyces sp. NPDC088725]|uniref:DUF5753 domain-containing protein n=1 Tax=Streptomyces sp. NPDC088725 TaxID=3365873 RepID=UPI003825E53B